MYIYKFNTKKKIILVSLFLFVLLVLLGNYNREIIKTHINELVAQPSIKAKLINVSKVAIPLKNRILMRNIDDKITLLKSSGSCIFCDFTQGNLEGIDLNGADLRYANFTDANLSNTNLSEANLSYANLSGSNLTDSNLKKAYLYETNLSNTDLTGVNLRGVTLKNSNLTEVNLSRTNLDGVDLRNLDLTRVNLSGVDLSNKDFAGTILAQSNLSRANLSSANLTDAILSNASLSETILTEANLSGVNLDGVDLRNLDLTRVNLSGVDLTNKDLTGTILIGANLSGVNLDGVDLRNLDLTRVNLSGVDLTNKDLTGTILKDAKKIRMSIKNSSTLNWTALNETQNQNIIRYDLSGKVKYLATKEGLLFELKNNESKLVLDLNNDPKHRFSSHEQGGLLGIASQNELVFVSYTSKDIDGLISLVVDEYSMNFSKSRNVIKIEGFIDSHHFGGDLAFDQSGNLYLSVGDGCWTQCNQDNKVIYKLAPQNLNDYKGKILRLDISGLKLEPEIVAYGIRSPWGISIDSKDRMFILDCGWKSVESVYLLNDLNTGIPANLGWPVFEGSQRMMEHPLVLDDVLAPIFETNTRPGCVTAGVYLDNLELFVFADFYGNIRLLNQKEDGNWYLFDQYKQQNSIWSFSLDKKTNKIFVAPDNLELEIFEDLVEY
jgi:uncharacterized protein YjbI with pentapeptide repeats